MTEEFKILSESEHVLRRPAMYIGSVTEETQEHISFREKRNYTVVPGLIKIIEEIFQNSVDEAIRTNFKHAKKIRINFGSDASGEFVEVSDNGRGIPVEKLPEGYRPALAWSRARAGTSFDDNRVTIGANGVGAMLTATFSTKFIGETDDGKKHLKFTSMNNLEKQDVVVTASMTKGTCVRFYPDMKRFGIEHITQDHVDLIKDRVRHLAICYSKIEFVFNGESLKLGRKDVPYEYADHSISMIDDHKTIIITGTPKNVDGFQQISYVNGIYFKNGGSHIKWFIDNLISQIVPIVKRKWKIEIPPSQIQNNLMIVMYLSNFVNLKFDSQTKERLTNSKTELVSYFGFTEDDFKKFAKDFCNTPEIIDPIISAILHEKEKEEAALAKKLAKQAKTLVIANHIEAQSKNPKEKTLFICEGLSAMSPIITVRDANKVGAYALRGKVMNSLERDNSEIMKNKEYAELCAVLGLTFGKKADPAMMNYNRIALLTDADPDGASIYNGLLVFFSKWPELFEMGMIYKVKSPLFICTKKNKREMFYDRKEYQNAKLDSTWEINYIKGLGTLEESDYSTVINSPVLVRLAPLSQYDYQMIDVAFGGGKINTKNRQEWLLTNDDTSRL